MQLHQPPHISFYIEQCRSSGAMKVSSPPADAVLLIANIGNDSAEDPQFRTEFRSPFKSAPPAVVPKAPPRLAVGQLIPILKREGGAFPDRIGIGRAPNVDISIPLARLSKYHAYFTRDEKGGFFITDAGSTNGTFVDGARLDVKIAVPMRDKQSIGLGPHRFTFLTREGFVELVQRRATSKGAEG